MDKNEKKKIRVILSGGSVKSSFQLGVLSEILDYDKYIIDSVYGCSSGSLLSSFVATNKIDLAIEKFVNINNIDDIFERHTYYGIRMPNWKIILTFNAFFNLGAYKSVKLVNEIKDLLSEDELKIAQEKCHVVAYDVINNKETWFTGEDLIDGIRCSTAIWLLVPPIKYKDNIYSDGGVTEIFPLDYILQNNLDENFEGEYIFIDCDSRKPYKNTSSSNALSFMVDLHWATASRLSEMKLENFKNKIKNKIHIIRPDNTLLNTMEVDPVKMKEYFQAGKLKGEEFVKKIEK
jgi:predicted acylesterase/phospholipase RssA